MGNQKPEENPVDWRSLEEPDKKSSFVGMMFLESFVSIYSCLNL